MTEEFNVPADGVIPYKFFAVPTNFTEDKYVQFAEIRQGDRQLVHHVIVSVRYPGQGSMPAGGRDDAERREASRQQRRSERQSGEASARATDSDGRLVGWAPGEAPLILRAGQAKLIKKGSVLDLPGALHDQRRSGKDRTSVGLIFSQAPVEKRVITAGAVGAQSCDPAGRSELRSQRSSFTFKEDSHIDSLHPHMHVRGKDFNTGWSIRTARRRFCCQRAAMRLRLAADLLLQGAVAAPKGSRLECVAHYDNSVKQQVQPRPDQRWSVGVDQTWEEMMIGYLDYTLDKQDLRKQQPQAARH